MDRNYIVELIKQNRLQEAIRALEQATKGSHLHNDIIMLSSSYSEYAQMNRAATQDFQTLEMQRAKITNSLLSLLDDLSPEDLEQVKVAPKQVHYAAEKPVMGGIDKKWFLYGGGALLVLLILYFAFSRRGETEEYIDPSNQSTTTETSNNAATDGTTANGTKQDLDAIRIVEVSAGGGKVAAFKFDGTDWVEETKNAHFKYKEVKAENNILYLRDDTREIDLELNFDTNEVLCSQHLGKSFVLYRITGTE